MEEEQPKTEKDSLFSICYYPVGFAAMGVASALIGNSAARRPLYSGIHKHITLGLAGALFGYYVELYFQRKWAYRDAVVKHYVELHPEDFVDTRRKYKEIFEEWKPIR